MAYILEKCTVIYFSPTYTTEKIVNRIAKDLANHIQAVDLIENGEAQHFSAEDFVVVGIPVYSGRVPNLAKEKLLAMTGEGTPVVLVATFGNRDYDDSLLELKTLLQENGFLVVGAGAFSTEHSVVRKFGKGRPNQEDIQKMQEFAALLRDKMKTWNPASHTDVTVKGNPEYRKYQTIPFKPHANSKCIQCGLCAAKCPAQAISRENPRKTEKQKCVTCMRCIYICPQKGRDLYTLEKVIAEKGLAKVCQEYKQPEIFI